MIFFQTNGQFFWSWFNRNSILISILFGPVISYLFICGTKYMVTYFDGTLWENRLMGFALGILTFTILTYSFTGEGINLKTAITLLLATIIVLTQIYWK